MRPLFPKDFRNDVQIVATVLSTDQEQDPATLAVTGASCALQISGIPHGGPVACVRVGMLDGRADAQPDPHRNSTSRRSTWSSLERGTPSSWSRPERTRSPSRRCSQALRMAHDEIRKLVRVPARPARCDRQADDELSVAEGIAGYHRGGARARRIANRRCRPKRRQGLTRGGPRSTPAGDGRRPRGAFPRCAV